MSKSLTIPKKIGNPAVAVEVLEAARSLIAAPERWTQNWVARDADGAAVEFRDTTATCFCSVGAIMRTVRDLNLPRHGVDDPIYDSVMLLRANTGKFSVASFNDMSTHEQVLAVFDKTITQTKERLGLQ
jgi:hypothetical protein